jgi:outer membrane protein assembly factor BamE (lipoprotein component of BamABCDE complex)
MALRSTLKHGIAVAALTIALGAVLGGCTGEVITHGYVLDDKALGEVQPGQSVEKVLSALGTPSTVSTVGNKTFYYISQLAVRRVQFLQPRIADQRVLAVYFDKNFKVERVANYGLQDGQVFDFISRTTPSSGSERTLVAQLFKGGMSMNPFAGR